MSMLDFCPTQKFLIDKIVFISHKKHDYSTTQFKGLKSTLNKVVGFETFRETNLIIRRRLKYDRWGSVQVLKNLQVSVISFNGVKFFIFCSNFDG